MDDVVAVVARGLVGAEAAHAARFLEDDGGADHAVDDADGCGVDHHTGTASGDHSGLVVVAVRQVDRDEILIQDAQLVQELGGPLAVSLHDLIGLSVALLYVQVHLRMSLLDGFLRLEEHFGAHEVRALGSEEDADVALVVPFIEGLDVGVHFAFTHLVVELVELAGIVDLSLRGTEHGSQVASGADLRDKFRAAVHFDIVIAQTGGAGLDGLDDSHTAALDLLVVLRRVYEGLQGEHHPVVGVLRQAAQHVVQRVHVRVDESGEDNMIFQVQDLVCLIFAVYCCCIGKTLDLTAVYDHGDSGLVADALAFHGVKMRSLYNHVNFLHKNTSA